MAKIESLLKYCRFYRGEDESPYSDFPEFFFWSVERAWCENADMRDLDKQRGFIDSCGLSSLPGDDVPLTLRAALFSKWCGDSVAPSRSLLGRFVERFYGPYISSTKK